MGVLQQTTTLKRSSFPRNDITIPYIVFLVFAVAVSYLVANMKASVFLTLGGVAQCLALTFLSLGSFGPNGVANLSLQSLTLYVLSLALRLSSTVRFDGYLPVDATGDWLYQTIDAVSLVAATVLLCRILLCRRRAGKEVHGETNQHGEGLGPLVWGVPAAFVLATVFHGNMDAQPIFDTFWMAGWFLASAAPLPQLRNAVADSRFAGEHVTHSFLAAALGQLFVLVYMWFTRQHITCKPWMDGVSHTIWFVLAAPVVHLAIVCDAVPHIKSFIAEGA